MQPFLSIEEFKKRTPTTNTVPVSENTEPTTFSKMMSEQFEQLKQHSVQCVEPAIQNTTSEIEQCINSVKLEQDLMLFREIMQICVEAERSRDRYEEEINEVNMEIEKNQILIEQLSEVCNIDQINEYNKKIKYLMEEKDLLKKLIGTTS